MTIICAWCGRTMAEGSGDVSHGMCEACEARIVSAVEQVQRETEAAAAPRGPRACGVRRSASGEAALRRAS